MNDAINAKLSGVWAALNAINKHWTDIPQSLGACEGALEYATFEEFWRDCVNRTGGALHIGCCGAVTGKGEMMSGPLDELHRNFDDLRKVADDFGDALQAAVHAVANVIDCEQGRQAEIEKELRAEIKNVADELRRHTDGNPDSSSPSPSS